MWGLRAILNKSWQQHPTRHQLYGHPPPITKTIQVWRTRHAGHCWRSRDELIRDVLLWTAIIYIYIYIYKRNYDIYSMNIYIYIHCIYICVRVHLFCWYIYIFMHLFFLRKKSKTISYYNPFSPAFAIVINFNTQKQRIRNCFKDDDVFVSKLSSKYLHIYSVLSKIFPLLISYC